MPDLRMSELVGFGPFELDLATAELHSSGGKIRLPEQQFKILVMLLRGEGNLVSREEIRKQLWPNDTVVEFDRSINTAIKKLRAALEDSAEAPRFIETVARRGYRILVAVDFPVAAPDPSAVRRSADGSLAGQKVSHYRVLTLLGGGGMGLVYKAEDLKLNRLVALKFLPEELAADSLAIQRFEREARASSALNHPNICTIHGVEEYGTQPFIVMELLEGESLRELIARCAVPDSSGTSHLSIQQFLEIAVHIAAGLEAAHEKGIVHRDVKPANIFVTTRGQVKILDFGLAKLSLAESEVPSDSHKEDRNTGSHTAFSRESSIEHSLSRTGIAMGTAGYMSPEQVRGEKLDSRTDLFSFGLILFEMATGQRAFSGDSAAIVQDAILHRAFPSVRELNPELPVNLEKIIRRALEKDRESRYQTAAEMLAELKSVLKTIQVVPPLENIRTSTAPGESYSSSHRALRAGTFIGGGLLVLLGAISLLWWKYSRPSPPTEIKERKLTTSSSGNPISGAAISGDGKYLAYGDTFGIQVRSLESGETREIPNPAQFGNARVFWGVNWFPDSTRFFAVSHPIDSNRVITWEASLMGGVLHRVREDAEAWAVSPDGSSVAATMADGHELWVMGTDGGNPRKLLDVGENDDVGNVQWSPDGTKLLYLKSDENRYLRANGEYGTRRSIEIRDVKSSATHVVLSDPQLQDLYWLRDGRVVYALVQGTEGETCNYWVARIDQKTGAFVSGARQLTHNSGFYVEDISATADSKKLVFAKRSYTGTVYVADVEAGGTRITPPRHLSMTEGDEYPNGWTADSREVVFTSNRDGKWGIYRQPLSGGPAQPVLVGKSPPYSQDGFGFPCPSPDGRWLLIERAYPGSVVSTRSDLLRVPMTGGQEELIARDIYGGPHCSAPSIQVCAYSTKENNELIFTSFDPQLKQRRELGRFKMDPRGFHYYLWALSPDATKIAILPVNTGNIYLLNLKTQALEHIIVKHWSNFENMDWTADGKGLFMSSYQTNGALLHIDLHGNARVLWEPGGESQISALPSPDGKHVAMPYYLANVNVWMMENF